MGDYHVSWNDGTRIPDTGIAIPRRPGSGHSNQHHHTDIGIHIEDYSPHNQQQNMTRPVNNQWSNTMDQYSNFYDNYQNSPQYNDILETLLSSAPPTNSSLFFSNQSMDMDSNVKLEPYEEDIFQAMSLPSNIQQDEMFCDNINLDVPLTGQMDLSAPTCLDPQHSSPAAMAAVRPSDVMGICRASSTPASSTPSTSNFSLDQNIKMEGASILGVPSSYPPREDFKDPFLNASSSVPTHMLHQNINQNIFLNDKKPDLDIMMNKVPSAALSPQNHLMHQQQHTLQFPSPNTDSTSALQELLQSPSHSIPTPLSPQSVSSPLSIHSPRDEPFGQSVPRPSSFSSVNNPMLTARLSSSAPAPNYMDTWQRREPRQHLLSTGSLAEEFGGSASSISTAGIMSPIGNELTLDDGGDSEVDSDNENFDSDSDNESIMSEDTASGSSKKDRSFWQYNVQAKGPKGQKVNITHNLTDPHILSQPSDPVFSNFCTVQGIKHSGKARRGDGNDLTPSPRKLVNIGKELDKLNKQINDMTPVSELPFNVRPKCRKEKNKLASRACRLKKKAQHEANKIKLYGLEQEHRGMINLLSDMKKVLIHKLELNSKSGGPPSTSHFQGGGMLFSPPVFSDVAQDYGQGLSAIMEKMVKGRCKHKIAGHTTEFVNRVIETCRSGKSNGGLEELAQSFCKTNLTTTQSTSPEPDSYI